MLIGPWKWPWVLCAEYQLCISGHRLLFPETGLSLGKVRSWLFWKDRRSTALEAWHRAMACCSIPHVTLPEPLKVHAFNVFDLLVLSFAWCAVVVKFQLRWVTESRLFQRWKATQELLSRSAGLNWGMISWNLTSLRLQFKCTESVRGTQPALSTFSCRRREAWARSGKPDLLGRAQHWGCF